MHEFLPPITPAYRLSDMCLNEADIKLLKGEKTTVFPLLSNQANGPPATPSLMFVALIPHL